MTNLIQLLKILMLVVMTATFATSTAVLAQDETQQSGDKKPAGGEDEEPDCD